MAATPTFRRYARPMSSVERIVGRDSLFRNAVAGAVATGADFASVVSFVKAGWISVPAATFAGCVIGAIVNFLINRWWAFGSNMAYGRQILRYGMVSGGSAVLNAGLVAMLLIPWKGSYQVVWGAARALVFLCWNYPLHRWYVFARAPSRSP